MPPANTSTKKSSSPTSSTLPTTTRTTTTTTTTTIALPAGVHSGTAGVFVCAVILLVAILVRGGPRSKGSGYWAYGIALAVVAMVVTMANVYAHKPGLLQDNPRVPFFLGQFLFLWCFFGACIMTFGNGPFVLTSNGYFAAWGMAIFALGHLPSLSSLQGHLAASIVVIVAIIAIGFQSNKGEAVFGLIMAIVSIIVALLYMKTGLIPTSLTFPVFLVIAICWIVCASLMTFRGPFLVTGNGYFGSWVAAITAVYCASAEYR